MPVVQNFHCIHNVQEVQYFLEGGVVLYYSLHISMLIVYRAAILP